MIVGVPKETFPGERRVALIPASVPSLKQAGLEVLLEAGAGEESRFPDRDYIEQGADTVADRNDLFSRADVIVQVRACGANPEAGRADWDRLREAQVLIAMCEPLSEPNLIAEFAPRKVTAFALELLPRITRAQNMDVLSSMATVAGYKAVLLAANHLPRMFPMLMTAAGTITPAKVFVVGAGVAGLQAIATAKRLGAVVHGYDIRPACREQVESLGGRFVELDLKTEEAEGKGGYAREMDEQFIRKQREMMTKVVAESDVVVTTAAVPGKTAPVLITGEMVQGMAPGSVIVDLAAERGGNCEPTRPGESVVENGVTVLGPTNLPSEVPYHASQMFSRNVSNFLRLLIQDGKLEVNLEDQIIHDTLVTRDGEVVHAGLREQLGLPAEQHEQQNEPESTGEKPTSDDEYRLREEG